MCVGLVMEAVHRGDAEAPPARRTWNPFETCLSLFTYSFVTPLIDQGAKKPLEADDLPLACPPDRARVLFSTLDREWRRETVERARPRFYRAVLASTNFWHSFLLVLSSAGKVCASFILGLIIDWFHDAHTRGSDADWSRGCLLALYMTLCIAVGAISHHTYFLFAWRRGMQMRTAAMAVMYDRVVRMRRSAMASTTVGHVVNLASSDVQRFAMAGMFLPYLVFAPVETVVVFILLWFELGYGAVAGFGVMVFVFLPLQLLFSNKFAMLRLKAATQTDRRVKLMSEVITGAAVLKCYAWENPFSRLIRQVREKEIHEIKWTAALRGLNEGVYFSCAVVVSIVMFLTYIGTGNQLSARKVFVSFTLMLIVRLDMTKFFAFAVKEGSEALVAADRIEAFLLQDQRRGGAGSGVDDDEAKRSGGMPTPADGRKTTPESIPLKPIGDNAGGVDAGAVVEEEKHEAESVLRPSNPTYALEKVTAAWDSKAKHVALRDISLEIPTGGLVVIVGRVGHGKTSLLLTLAGELRIVGGAIRQRADAAPAFVAQEPWILSGTVRDNILFGSALDAKRYAQVAQACCLEPDFQQLNNRDLTLVGDKGVTLSGGQKARVALARAAYSDRNVMLLDDPLSAVDPHVAKHLFDDCICGAMRGRTRVLVTHQLQFIQKADSIVVLDEGRVAAVGSFEQLVKSGLDVASLLKEYKKSEDEDDKARDEPTAAVEIDTKASRGAVDPAPSDNASAPLLMASKSLSRKEVRKLEQERKRRKEDRNTGKISKEAFFAYLGASGSPCYLTMVMLSMVAGQALIIGTVYYFSVWAQAPEHDQDAGIYVGLAIGLGVVTFLVSSGRSVWLLTTLVGAAQKLHDSMFASVVRLPMRFFDTNPAGRVLNRFSNDMGLVDDLMPSTLFDVVSIGLQALGVVILACVVNPLVIAMVLPLAYACYHVQQRYLLTSRETKRLDALSRSPVFAQFTETLAGAVSLRAFGAQGRFLRDFATRLDRNTEAFFAFVCTARWLGVRLDVCVQAFMIFVTYSAILMQFFGFNISAELVGLSLTYLVQLGDALQWAVRQSAEFENQLVSVERIRHYVSLKSEAPLALPEDSKLPSGWPSEGGIRFVNFSARYAPHLPLVLKNLTCAVPGGLKVGIVGRTGAGKSSVVQCLFRLVEPWRGGGDSDGVSQIDANGQVDAKVDAKVDEKKNSGCIQIDGVNTTSIGLHALRKSMSIIPQSPWLFSGSVRENLDPFGDHSDDDINKALDDVQLGGLFESLDATVAEAGGNLSTGQKQLICLARAILRDNRIIVCDEATAHVDLQTDKIIQKTIREKFANRTVLMVAHRLNTVIDCDIVAVLDAGKLVEFGHPHELLTGSTAALFKDMVAKTGKDAEKSLRAEAKRSWSASRAAQAEAKIDVEATAAVQAPDAVGDVESGQRENKDQVASI